MHLILAASWLDPIVNALYATVNTIDKPIGNLGWSLVILAALIRLIFWPLNTLQFKSFLAMQKVGPQLKKLQERYKDDKQRLQAETMTLYKEHKVNPFAGCWPMLVQYPVIISVYYVVLNHRVDFEKQSWLWVGSAFSRVQATLVPVHAPAAAHAAAAVVQNCVGLCLFNKPILGLSLATPDLILILLYALSMYLSVRFVSMPATDPQQAQTQRMMAVISPVMLGFLGWRYGWPSAMVLYWFAYNIFTMAQQFYLLRRYHQPLALIDSEHVLTDTAPGGGSPKALKKPAPSGNGVAQAKPPQSGRSKRRNKR